MQFLTGVFLVSVAEAGHFRAAGYTVIQNESGGLTVMQTQAWMRIHAGYTNTGCTADHVSGQVVSAPTGWRNSTCFHQRNRFL